MSAHMQAVAAQCAASWPRPAAPKASARAAQRPCSSTTSRICSRRLHQQAGGAAPRGAAVAPAAAAKEQVDAWGEPIGPNEVGILSQDVYLDGLPDALEGRGGYTPYELIDFTDIQLKHEVVVRVEKPLREVYALWENRLNWPEWFGMIEDVGFTAGVADVCALNMWYRWAMTPWLQLYVALQRTAEQGKYILEEPVDGAPIVAAVLFQEEEGEDGAPPATSVVLRVSYLLPQVLYEFAGRIAVFADVDRKLNKGMAAMKEWVEEADTAEALADAEENMRQIREDLPTHLQQAAEAEARFQEEKARWQEQQQTAAAAAARAEALEDDAAVAAAAAAADAADAEAAAAAAAAPKKRGSKKAAGPAVANPMSKRRTKKAAEPADE